MDVKYGLICQYPYEISKHGLALEKFGLHISFTLCQPINGSWHASRRQSQLCLHGVVVVNQLARQTMVRQLCRLSRDITLYGHRRFYLGGGGGHGPPWEEEI